MILPGRVQLQRAQRDLEKQYKCHPWVTAGVPIIGQMVPFLAASLTFRQVALPPTPFDAESFFTLTSLASIDYTTTLPIAVGLITMANVEMSTWFRPLRGASPSPKPQTELTEPAPPKISLAVVIKPILRFMALFRVVVASFLPGVCVYLVRRCSSSLFTVNVGGFNLLDCIVRARACPNTTC